MGLLYAIGLLSFADARLQGKKVLAPVRDLPVETEAE